MQILISNYAIPAGYKLDPCRFRRNGESVAPILDFSKVKFLPLRTDIVYRDNAGYKLTIDKLPWGVSPFSIKRYRISKTENFDLVETGSGKDGILNLSHSLPTDTVELIVLNRH